MPQVRIACLRDIPMEVYVTRLPDGSLWFQPPVRIPGFRGLAIEGLEWPLNEVRLRAIASMLRLPSDEPIIFLIMAGSRVVRT